MSTLSSSSTLAEIQAAYDDNAPYAEDGDTAMCLTFLTACRMLLRRMPKQTTLAGRGGHEVQMDMQLIHQELKAAERWYSTQNTAGRVKSLSVQEFRT